MLDHGADLFLLCLVFLIGGDPGAETSMTCKRRSRSRRHGNKTKPARLDELETPPIKVQIIEKESLKMNAINPLTTSCHGQTATLSRLDSPVTDSLIKVNTIDKDNIYHNSKQVVSDKQDKYQCLASYMPETVSPLMHRKEDRSVVHDRVYIPKGILMDELNTVHPVTCTMNSAHKEKHNLHTCHSESETDSASETSNCATKMDTRIQKSKYLDFRTSKNVMDFLIAKNSNWNNSKVKTVFPPEHVKISVPLPGQPMKTTRHVSLITPGRTIPNIMTRKKQTEALLECKSLKSETEQNVSGVHADPMTIKPSSCPSDYPVVSKSFIPSPVTTSGPVVSSCMISSPVPTSFPVVSDPVTPCIVSLTSCVSIKASPSSLADPDVSSPVIRCIMSSVPDFPGSVTLHPASVPVVSKPDRVYTVMPQLGLSGSPISSIPVKIVPDSSCTPSLVSTASPVISLPKAAPVSSSLRSSHRSTAASVVSLPTTAPVVSTSLRPSQRSTAACLVSSSIMLSKKSAATPVVSLPSAAPAISLLTATLVASTSLRASHRSTTAPVVSIPTAAPVVSASLWPSQRSTAAHVVPIPTAAPTVSTPTASKKSATAPVVSSLLLQSTLPNSFPSSWTAAAPVVSMPTAAPVVSMPTDVPVASMPTAEPAASSSVLQSIISTAGPAVHKPIRPSQWSSATLTSCSVKMDHSFTAAPLSSMPDSISILPSLVPEPVTSNSISCVEPESSTGMVESDPIIIDMKDLTATSVKRRPEVSMIPSDSTKTRSLPAVVTSTPGISKSAATNVFTHRPHPIPDVLDHGISNLTPTDVCAQHPTAATELTSSCDSDDTIHSTAPVTDPDSSTSQTTIRLSYDPLDLNSAKEYLQQIGLYPLPPEQTLNQLQPLPNHLLTNKLVMALSWTYTDPNLQRQIVKRLSLEDPHDISDNVLSILMKNMWQKGMKLRKKDILGFRYEKFLEESFWYEPDPHSACKPWIIKCNQLSQTDTEFCCQNFKKTNIEHKAYITFLERERQADSVTVAALAAEVKSLKKKNQKVSRMVNYQTKQLAKFKRKTQYLRNRLLQLRHSAGK